MRDRIRGRGLLLALLSALAAAVLAACGGGSDNVQTLLKQTFGGNHPVNSGNLSVQLQVTPSGSSTLTRPLSLSFGGPFQSLGTGKLPKSNFTISFSAQGKSGSLGIVSTGTTGYVTLQGSSYQLPQATFQRLESSFGQLASSSGSGSGGGTLSRLGIHPLDWLTSPSIVGKQSVGGTDTTHIHATINVASLLSDLNTFLQKASAASGSSSSSIPSSISPSTRQKIANEVQHPSFDVWTGSSDKTVRRLQVRLTLPVTGQISTLLGGLRSADIALTMAYADLNQPQTIAVPTNVRPFTEFASKLKSFLGALQGSLAGASGAASGGSPSAGGTNTGSSASVQRYSQCIIAAHNDVAKMQQCASLINK